MVTTLFFPGSKCIVPWYLVEQIAKFHLMKKISWAKAIKQFLIESLDNFKLATSELQGYSLQILVSIIKLLLLLLLTAYILYVIRSLISVFVCTAVLVLRKSRNCQEKTENGGQYTKGSKMGPQPY